MPGDHTLQRDELIRIGRLLAQHRGSIAVVARVLGLEAGELRRLLALPETRGRPRACKSGKNSAPVTMPTGTKCAPRRTRRRHVLAPGERIRLDGIDVEVSATLRAARHCAHCPFADGLAVRLLIEAPGGVGIRIVPAAEASPGETAPHV